MKEFCKLFLRQMDGKLSLNMWQLIHGFNIIYKDILRRQTIKNTGIENIQWNWLKLQIKTKNKTWWILNVIKITTISTTLIYMVIKEINQSFESFCLKRKDLIDEMIEAIILLNSSVRNNVCPFEDL